MPQWPLHPRYASLYLSSGASVSTDSCSPSPPPSRFREASGRIHSRGGAQESPPSKTSRTPDQISERRARVGILFYTRCQEKIPTDPLSSSNMHSNQPSYRPHRCALFLQHARSSCDELGSRLWQCCKLHSESRRHMPYQVTVHDPHSGLAMGKVASVTARRENSRDRQIAATYDCRLRSGGQSTYMREIPPCLAYEKRIPSARLGWCAKRESLPASGNAPHWVLLLQRLLLVPTLPLAHDPELVSVQVAVAPRRVSIIRLRPYLLTVQKGGGLTMGGRRRRGYSRSDEATVSLSESKEKGAEDLLVIHNLDDLRFVRIRDSHDQLTVVGRDTLRRRSPVVQ